MPYNIVSFLVTAIFLNRAVWGFGYAEVYQYHTACPPENHIVPAFPAHV